MSVLIAVPRMSGPVATDWEPYGPKQPDPVLLDLILLGDGGGVVGQLLFHVEPKGWAAPDDIDQSTAGKYGGRAEAAADVLITFLNKADVLVVFDETDVLALRIWLVRARRLDRNKPMRLSEKPVALRAIAEAREGAQLNWPGFARAVLNDETAERSASDLEQAWVELNKPMTPAE